VLAFLSAVRAQDYSRATQYLNLDRIARSTQETRGIAAAKTLGNLLDRSPDFDIASLSNDPDGRHDDDLPADRELLYQGEEGRFRVEMQRRPLGATGSLVWVFSTDTVDRAVTESAASIEAAIESNLPPWVARWRFLRTPLWTWIALLMALTIAIAVSRALSMLALRILRPVCARLDPAGNFNVADAFTRPVRLLLSVVLFRVFLAWVPVSALGRFYIERAAGLVMILAIAWILSRVLDVFVSRLRMTLDTRRHTSLSRSALPLVSRVAKGFILILAVTLTLSNWGFDMTAALAGVGIGGIAIALAAQKTVENLFGGFAIITDGPVAVGDFCKFGDRVGTVEDIGLRSTRIRTLDRTLVTVPNAEFSGMVLENFSQRDKIWFHPTLNLRKDTTSAQLRQIMAALQHTLEQHQKVDAGPTAVRFAGAGAYSLDVEIFAYVRTANYDEYLGVQKELLLAFLDAIAAAGSTLALPSDTNSSLARTQPATPGRVAPQLIAPAQPRPQ
jgi:MscS family membrane protein